MRAIIMACTSLIALAGCGGAAPQAENGGSAAPATGAMASPDGRSEVRADAAFSGLPEGIPAYPGADGRGALQMGGREDGAEMRIMAFRTADSPSQVIAFYSDAAARAGYQVVRRAEVGPSSVLGLARDNGDAMNVTATGTPTGTNVQIMAGQEQERRRP